MLRGLLARHPELIHLSTILDGSSAWARWQVSDSRLSAFSTLDELTSMWVAHRSVECYPAIAALAKLGSARAHDHDDAALAVLVALHRDVDHVADQLRDVCDPDDLMWAVWDAVKRAEPQVGVRAPYYLLHRAKESLLCAHHRNSREVACQTLLDSETHGLAFVGIQPALAPGDEVENAHIDLSALLGWATSSGVIALEDAQLLHDLTRDLEGHGAVEAALSRAGCRLGVSMRTARRRRDITIQRLRGAAPDFLATAS